MYANKHTNTYINTKIIYMRICYSSKSPRISRTLTYFHRLEYDGRILIILNDKVIFRSKHRLNVQINK